MGVIYPQPALTASTITPNALFDSLSVVTGPPGDPNAEFSALVAFPSTITDSTSSGSPFQVDLGTFALIAGSTPGVFTISTANFDELPGPINVTSFGETVDPTAGGFGTATITIQANGPVSTVPEPGSMVLF